MSARFFLPPEFVPWELALVVQLFVLLLFAFYPLKDQEKRRIFFGLIFIFLCSLLFSGKTNPFIIILLGSAGAGAIIFFSGGGSQGLFVYLFSTTSFVFFLKPVLPEVTLLFIGGSLLFLFVMWVLAKMKGQAFHTYLSQSGTKLIVRKPLIPFLLFLNCLLWVGGACFDFDPWINSMALQINIYLFLILITKNIGIFKARCGEAGPFHQNTSGRK